MHAGLGGVVGHGAHAASPLLPLDDPPDVDPLEDPPDDPLAPELEPLGSVMSEPDVPEHATTSAKVEATTPAKPKSRFPIGEA